MTRWWSRRGIRGSTPTPRERTAVRDFVGDGGGLLLMSNRGDLPGSNPHDMTRYDAIMARQFGVGLECTWFQNPSMGELWKFF